MARKKATAVAIINMNGCGHCQDFHPKLEEAIKKGENVEIIDTSGKSMRQIEKELVGKFGKAGEAMAKDFSAYPSVYPVCGDGTITDLPLEGNVPEGELADFLKKMKTSCE